MSSSEAVRHSWPVHNPHIPDYLVIFLPPDPDVQSALCRTGLCTFYDVLHLFDGSTLHELWLVFRNLLEETRVHLTVERRLLRTCHNRGTEDLLLGVTMSHTVIALRG